MSTVMTWQISSESSDTTEQTAERLGRALRGSEVIELVSDLGGGKTTFTRGLARGAGSHDKVASPTFTINKVYDTPKFQIHHFDFYRLSEPGIIAEELSEATGDEKVVVVVEWADVVKHVLPPKRLTIHIKTKPDGTRSLELSAPKELNYLIEALK